MNWFEEQLLGWYDANKRDLPWRDSGDPIKYCLGNYVAADR